uniref:Uncharacterized protein n=1 Tax=Arundo donax TaxID=35708 RepID=A0A0A9BLX1_ARUDO
MTLGLICPDEKLAALGHHCIRLLPVQAQEGTPYSYSIK